MAAAYIGARLDIDILSDEDVINFVVEVFNADNTDYAFTGITDINFYIWDYNGKGQTLLKTITDGNGVSQSSNDVTLDFDYSFLFSSTMSQSRSACR